MTRQENERKCYSLEEVIVMLDVCRNTLMKLIRGNEFPYLKIGGVYRIPKESFDRWLDSESCLLTRECFRKTLVFSQQLVYLEKKTSNEHFIIDCM